MRYEKKTKAKESFIELWLDGARVRTAKGSRNVGDSDWSIKDSDVRTYSWEGDAEKAKAFYAEQIAKAEAGKFVAIGDDMPILSADRAKSLADAAHNEAHGALRKLEAAAGDAAAIAEAKAILEKWDTSLPKMDESPRAFFLKHHADVIERLRKKFG